MWIEPDFTKSNQQEYQEYIYEITRQLGEANFIRNTNRELMLVGKKGFTCPAVTRWCYLKNTYVVPRFDERNPELVKLIEDFVNTYFPEIPYNTFTINKNAEMMPHKDRKNKDHSFIIGLGDYQGGELMIDKLGVDREEDAVYEPYNIKERPLVFDGANHYHKVLPFTGDRYTIVAYYV